MDYYHPDMFANSTRQQIEDQVAYAVTFLAEPSPEFFASRDDYEDHMAYRQQASERKRKGEAELAKRDRNPGQWERQQESKRRIDSWYGIKRA